MLPSTTKCFLLLCCLSLYGSIFGQCPPGSPGTGQFLDTPSGCVTNGLDIIWRLTYTNLADGDEIHIDWGDGTMDAPAFTVVGTPPIVEEFFPHTYTTEPADNSCLYTMEAFIVSPQGCSTPLETTVVADVIVWNTDNVGNNGPGLGLNPGVVQVCAGTVAQITFEDISGWNCTDPMISVGALNELQRWTQWEYGTTVNSIETNGGANPVLVGGNPVAMGGSFSGAINTHTGMSVLNPQPPGNMSLEVEIPLTAMDGEQFSVRLNNWNQCNEYDDGMGVPPVNPPVFEEVIIEVIAPPVVTVTAVGGTNFCVGEQIQFQYGGPNNPNFTFLWDFGDGNTSMDMDPVHTYTTAAVYGVSVQVTNNGPNIIACQVQTNPPQPITIIDAPIPVIAVQDNMGAAASSEHCVEAVPIDLQFLRDPVLSSVPNPANTIHTWNFYVIDDPGTIDVTIPDAGVPIPRTYVTPGEYLVELVSTDNLSMCENIAQETILLYDDPQATFMAMDICAGDRTNFNSISALDAIPKQVNGDIIDIWEWDFSYDGVNFNPELTLADNSDFNWFLDGNPVIGEVEPATSVAGTYTIALRTTTQLGMCSDLFQTDITVKTLPDANFTSNYAVPICPDEAITFTNNSVQPPEVTIGGPVDYELVIDDNIGSPTMVIPFIGPDLTMNFDNTSGANINYFVSLQATGANPNNCVQVNGPQVLVVKAAFESGFDDPAFDPFGENCSPLTGTLMVDAATQALNVDSYTWTIFDGTDPIDGFPQTINNGAPNFHQLDYQIDNTSQSAVNYRVLLEPELAGVCVNSSEIMLRVNPVPTTSFSQTDNIDECETKEVIFSADQAGLVTYDWSFSTPPDIIDDQGEELRVLWNRPDAASGDLVVTVTLNTENGFDCPAVTTSNFDLLVSPQPDDIIVLCEVNPQDLVLPESTVEIINNTVDNNFGFFWDFGDGNTSNQRDPGTHTYDSEGSFDVTLTVSSGFCEESRVHRVNILPTFPVVDFEADNPNGCPPHVVNFTNLSQFAQDSLYLWDFGDGNTSTEVNPSNLYLEPGRYTVTLQATNSLGDTDTEIKQFFVEVYDLPIASFDPRPREVFLPASVTMVNLSRGTSTYEWSFGDGGASEEIEPIYEYTEEGDYDITLVATSEDGCTDTITIGAAVNAVIGGEVRAPNAFTPNPDGPNGGAVNGAGGGLNDVFLPLIAGVTDFRMQIFNRWGNIMFETTSREVGWDGYFNGRLAPQGVYVYRLELTFQNNQRSVRVGDFTLIR